MQSTSPASRFYNRFFNREVLVFLLIGTVTRLVYALHFQPWLQAPDQLASEFLLRDMVASGTLRYDALIHYPHEGGAILLSILALLPKLLGSFNSLAIAAALMDLISRTVQLAICKRLFPRDVFLFFGLWSVFALPSVIPWSTLSYGLHALGAVFPFLLFAMMDQRAALAGKPALHGVLLGLFIWFSYTNVLLILPYVVWLFADRASLRSALQWVIGLGVTLALHATVRTLADPGFALAAFTSTTIRGLDYAYLQDPATYKHLYEVWVDSVPGASMLTSMLDQPATSIRICWNWINLIGLLGLIVLAVKRKGSPTLWMGVGVVFLFVSAYAISPFYEPRTDRSAYVYFRHFAYILPLLSLVVLAGLSALPSRLKYVVAVLYLGLGAISYGDTIRQPGSAYLAVRPAGWVLGTKLGHDPERLGRLAHSNPEQRDELLIGFGWGITSTLLADSTAGEDQLNRVCDLVRSFSESDQAPVMQGVCYAFSDQVTPVLDQSWLPQLEACGSLSLANNTTQPIRKPRTIDGPMILKTHD